MRTFLGTAFSLVFLPPTLLGQAADQPPSFEVASVRIASPNARGGSISGGPGTADPTFLRCLNSSLQNLLMYAYALRGYQIFGPDWLATERYDITAAVPAGATKESVRLMLQRLLGERLRLTVHHETRPIPSYELLVLKNGPKMKRAAPAGAPDGAGAGPGGITVGKDGLPVLPPGKPNMISMMVEGHLHMAARAEPVSVLAEMLGSQLRRPVVDRTGLTGTYDFTLDFAFGDAAGPLEANAPAAGDAPSLMIAVQEQLGLKLEERRTPTDVIVVDHAERIPTEN